MSEKYWYTPKIRNDIQKIIDKANQFIDEYNKVNSTNYKLIEVEPPYWDFSLADYYEHVNQIIEDNLPPLLLNSYDKNPIPYHMR